MSEFIFQRMNEQDYTEELEKAYNEYKSKHKASYFAGAESEALDET